MNRPRNARSRTRLVPGPALSNINSAGNLPEARKTDRSSSEPREGRIPLPRHPIEPRSKRVRKAAPTVSSETAAWISEAMCGIRKLAATGKPFQCHDLVLLCGVSEPPDHHLWGSLMSIARAEGLVVAVAATPSSRPRTAKSLCRLWVGAEHAGSVSDE